jgi:hypothetical protein
VVPNKPCFTGRHLLRLLPFLQLLPLAEAAQTNATTHRASEQNAHLHFFHKLSQANKRCIPCTVRLTHATCSTVHQQIKGEARSFALFCFFCFTFRERCHHLHRTLAGIPVVLRDTDLVFYLFDNHCLFQDMHQRTQHFAESPLAQVHGSSAHHKLSQSWIIWQLDQGLTSTQRQLRNMYPATNPRYLQHHGTTRRR